MRLSSFVWVSYCVCVWCVCVDDDYRMNDLRDLTLWLLLSMKNTPDRSHAFSTLDHHHHWRKIPFWCQSTHKWKRHKIYVYTNKWYVCNRFNSSSIRFNNENVERKNAQYRFRGGELICAIGDEQFEIYAWWIIADHNFWYSFGCMRLPSVFLTV